MSVFTEGLSFDDLRGCKLYPPAACPVNPSGDQDGGVSLATTRIVGGRFYLYAVDKWPVRRTAATAKVWSLDLAVPGDCVPPWMAELANGLQLFPTTCPSM